MGKKNISPIVSGAGLLAAVWTELDRAVRERGGSDEDLYRLNTPEGKSIIAKLADVIVASNTKQVKASTGDTFTVTVDYTKSLADMIAAGKYDWVNNNIVEKNFPVQRPGIFGQESATEGGGPFRTPGVQNSNIKIVLVHLNKVATTTEVLQHMDKLGLRPARLEELLALGEKHPDLQRQFPIVALGSVWVHSDGNRRVPYLCASGSERYLGLFWGDPYCRWDEDFRFVAVSK